MKLSKLLGKSLVLAAVAGFAPAVFAAIISTGVSPVGPIPLGSSFTVTMTLSGYTGSTEIDGYEFKIAYPAALFSFVGGSIALNDGSGFGAAENWLRKAPQDGVGAGSILTDGTTMLPGIVNVSVVDLRGASTMGTTAASGFLFAFDLMATGIGTGSITPSVPLSGDVLFDVSLSPVSPPPTFASAPMTVVPEPALYGLFAAGLTVLFAGRSRRRGGVSG